jgi:hypothetical protein
MSTTLSDLPTSGVFKEKEDQVTLARNLIVVGILTIAGGVGAISFMPTDSVATGEVQSVHPFIGFAGQTVFKTVVTYTSNRNQHLTASLFETEPTFIKGDFVRVSYRANMSVFAKVDELPGYVRNPLMVTSVPLRGRE